MTESQENVPHEVRAVQAWMSAEIIDTGVCPPLRRLSNRHRDAEGEIDWESMGEDISIVSFVDYEPGQELLEAVTTEYLLYAQESIEGKPPFAKLLVLPDLSGVPEYTDYVDGLRNYAQDAFAGSEEGQELARIAHDRALPLKPDIYFEKIGTIPEADRPHALANGFVHPEDQEMLYVPLETYPDEKKPQVVAKRVVNRIYPPQALVGKDVTDEDEPLLRSPRGPFVRERMTSRAPYYVILVNDLFQGQDLMKNMDRIRIQDRNTRIAQETNFDVYNARVQSYRGGQST